MPVVSWASLPLRAFSGIVSYLFALEAGIRRISGACGIVLEAISGLVVVLAPSSSEASSSPSIAVRGPRMAKVHQDGRVLHPSWCI